MAHDNDRPVWSDPIHDVDFVKAVVDDINKAKDKYGTFTRMNGLLSVISEELPDCPLYYTTGSLCATMRCNQPSFTTLRSAFLNAGYRVSVSHANQDAVKTNAPPSVVWDIMRSWVKKNPVKVRRYPTIVVVVLLSREPCRGATALPNLVAKVAPSLDLSVRSQATSHLC